MNTKYFVYEQTSILRSFLRAFDPYIDHTMATHPTGVVVDIVGICASDRGRNCEEHAVCGSVLEIDTLVRFRAERIVVDGAEQTALSVFWVTDGVDRCRVGFLPRHLIKHKEHYDGRLGQVIDFLTTSESPGDKAKSHRNKGVCRAVLVEAERRHGRLKRPPPTDEDDSDSYTTPKKIKK